MKRICRILFEKFEKEQLNVMEEIESFERVNFDVFEMSFQKELERDYLKNRQKFQR